MSKRHDLPIDSKEWISQFSKLRGVKDVAMLQTALSVYSAQGDKAESQTQKGLNIADIVLGLGLDTESITVALLYPAFQAQELSADLILEKFGESTNKLLNDVSQIQSLGKLQHYSPKRSHHMENLRKMLLAIVTDVRAVLIILAERLWQLRQAKHLPSDQQIKIAQETLDVYAPLANRLGIWQLKWETEDLCMRYLQADTYNQIAKWLASRRQEREDFIQHMITVFSRMLKEAHIKDFEVTGRVKHIYSIHRKMERKHVGLEEIYDVSAIRILVHSIEECYNVLSLVQNEWGQIPEEFDDYISLPKPNGYRSIHAVIIGPEKKLIEVQIRTFQMHHESELGVAAHWRYKEGVLQTSSYESKIALLRQVMAWQQEIVDQSDVNKGQPVYDLFADRVYVFTPLGDIIDLPKGATPLDFAYYIHSEVGHRCRGAKINGKMVPLTHQLQTGDRVEILTAKEANPSRDWINPQYGYLATARARAKAQHWFRVKDHSLTMAQHSHEAEAKGHVKPVAPAPKPSEIKRIQSHIQILGIDNLLSNTAGCCKPLPGDPIIGYITRTKGVSIHRRDCGNILHVAKNHGERMIEVTWGEKSVGTHSVPLLLRIYDRPGLLRDITTVLAGDKINVSSLQTEKVQNSPEADIHLSIEIKDVQQLTRAIMLLKKIPNVIDVKRR